MAQQSQHEASGGGGIGAVQGNLNDIVTDVPSSTHFDFQFWLSLALVVIKSLWSLTVAVVLGVKSAILFVLSSTWRLSTGTLNLLLMPFKPFIYLFVFIVSPFVRITFAILDILRPLYSYLGTAALIGFFVGIACYFLSINVYFIFMPDKNNDSSSIKEEGSDFDNTAATSTSSHYQKKVERELPSLLLDDPHASDTAGGSGSYFYPRHGGSRQRAPPRSAPVPKAGSHSTSSRQRRLGRSGSLLQETIHEETDDDSV